MNIKANVLVTGCGGDIGQSVGKILNELSISGQIYGCDISDRNAAQFIYPNFLLGVNCKDERYVNELENLVDKYNIDLIIPISEPELRFFSKMEITKIGKAQLIIASPKALEVGFDKLFTAEFLKNENLPFPITNAAETIEKVEKFPIIMKSRTGNGSSDVTIVNDNATFMFIKSNNHDFIVQEFLDGGNGEYTCGLFRSKEGLIRTIILLRELDGAFTGYGEVIKNNDINRLLYDVAEKLQLIGSINVQLRITSKGPIIFEINPRFSSTVRFRHLLDFKDLEWSIEDKLGLPISDYNNISVGKKIFKGFSEYIS